MGTRSLTTINDDNGKETVVMYRQMDAYPEGHRMDLADFPKPFSIVNGYRLGDDRRIANGMDCLAAQLVSRFKGDRVGNFYLHPTATRNRGEEFIYIVSNRDGQLSLTVQGGEMTFFGVAGTDVGAKSVEDDTLIYDGPAADFTPKACKRRDSAIS